MSRKDLQEIKKIKSGTVIAVMWIDTTMHEEIRLRDINGDFLHQLKPTRTHGTYLGMKNGIFKVVMETCNDMESPATTVESIPVGMIVRIEIFKLAKTIYTNKRLYGYDNDKAK